MANVFLCHRKPDAMLVERLAGELGAAGHRIWFDEWEIGIGDSIIFYTTCPPVRPERDKPS